MKQGTSELEKKLFDLFTNIRLRPPMYFGTRGSAAIPVMTRFLIEEVLKSAPAKYCGPVAVSITGEKRQQTISVEFDGLNSMRLSPAVLDSWLDLLVGNWTSQLAIVAGASNRFTLESWDGERWARLEIRDGFRVSTKVSPAIRTPCLRVTFQPRVPVFGYLSHEGSYNIAGYLRDLSLLRRGTATRFQADALDGELRYFYKHGLKSLLFEDDYTRFSLHRGCLSFKASTSDMSVEGHLRFLHSGVPRMRSYVNFDPAQGGAHLEGLGDALLELFPDPSLGCRITTFVTNPDTGASIQVPHAFIGAMHVRVAQPRFLAPTRDVLCSKGVREFVRMAAIDPLKRQWNALRDPLRS